MGGLDPFNAIFSFRDRRRFIRETFCPLQSMPSPRASGAVMESSDELAVVAAVESMSVADRYIDKSEPEMPPGADDAPDVQPTASEATEPRHIRQDAVQGGTAARSGTAGNHTCPASRHQLPSGDDNGAQSGSKEPVSEGGDGTVGQLTAASVRQRGDELFPAGSSTPAVEPRQPPATNQPTNELATLVFEAASAIKAIYGKLAREEVSGYLLADLLGYRLLPAEALRVGESLRKASLLAKEGETKLKKNISAKKSTLRKKAEKDPARAASLDIDMQQLDSWLVAARAKLLQTQITLSGLPEAESEIVESRTKVCGDVCACEACTCPCGRAIPAMLGTEATGKAIRAIFMYEKALHKKPEPGSERSIIEEYEEEKEVLAVRYKHTLRQLKAAFPTENCDWDEDGACKRDRRCPCGRGRLAGWPWVLQIDARLCKCGRGLQERWAWVNKALENGWVLT